MKNKFLISALFILFNASVFAQVNKDVDFSDGVTSFIAWIKSIDKEISSINEKEKLRKLYRLMGDINLDIDNISTEKYILAINIGKIENFNNEIIRKGLQAQVDEIQGDISKLVSDLQSLKGLVNQTQMDITIDKVVTDFEIKKGLLLVDIERELNKANVDKKKILIDANQAKSIAEKANVEIRSTREKISLELQK